MICPYMSNLIVDDTSAWLKTKKDNYYTEIPIPGAFPKTDLDPTKALELYNFKDPSSVEVDNVYMYYPQCIGDKCQVWDSINSRCGTQVTDTIKTPSTENNNLLTMLEGVIGKIAEKDNNNSLIEYLQNVFGTNADKDANQSLLSFLSNIVGKDSELLGDDQSMLKIMKHIHDSHYHMYRHWVDELYTSKGNITGFGIQGVPLAAILLQEHLQEEDLDSNGEIFVRDFIIDQNDEDCPFLLKTYLDGVAIEEGVPIRSWASYESSIRQEP